MATVNSILFSGFSGRVGDMVFRQHNGRTFVSIAPSRTEKKPTAAQAAHTQRFREAIAYAKSALEIPLLAAFYRALETTKLRAFRLAVRDYLKPPRIDEIALGLFDGLAGDEIIITATDDTEVASVEVSLKDMTGRVLESGPAQNRRDDTWTYEAQHDLPVDQPVTIEVTAKDRPGNSTSRSTPWVPTVAPSSSHDGDR